MTRLARVLGVSIFAGFKVNCEVMPLHSFANFKLGRVARGPRPWPMRNIVTGTGWQRAGCCTGFAFSVSASAGGFSGNDCVVSELITKSTLQVVVVGL